MKTDIICIGHITHDRIVTPERDLHMPGGTSFYFSYGLRHLLGERTDIRYRLITSLAEKDLQAVDDMRREGIDVEVIPSRETVYFENIYGADQNNRQQRVRAKADPFTCEKLADVEAEYIVLGSLLADDFDLAVLRQLAEHGTLVVDAQGYLREVRDEKVYACDWNDKREALRYIDILKVNEHEIEVLTGEPDQHRACEILADWGVREVLLTLGSFGSVVALGSIAGPGLGGLILTYLPWTYIFWVNVPVGIAAIILGQIVLPKAEATTAGKIDAWGMLVLIFMAGSLFMGLILGQQVGFMSLIFLSLMIATIILLIIFIYLEKRAADPVMNFHLFSNIDFSLSLLRRF